jgi:hypothetical protein
MIIEDASDPYVVFPNVVRDILGRTAVEHTLESDAVRRRWTLSIPRGRGRAFDAGLVCESYGIYPWAGGWHGSPWDFGPQESTQRTCHAAVAFLQHVISPSARLRVLARGGKPYRWLLEFRDGATWTLYEETGSLVYNYLGRRSEQILANLPR